MKLWIEIDLHKKNENGAGKTIFDHYKLTCFWGQGECEWPLDGEMDDVLTF